MQCFRTPFIFSFKESHMSVFRAIWQCVRSLSVIKVISSAINFNVIAVTWNWIEIKVDNCELPLLCNNWISIVEILYTTYLHIPKVTKYWIQLHLFPMSFLFVVFVFTKIMRSLIDCSKGFSERNFTILKSSGFILVPVLFTSNMQWADISATVFQKFLISSKMKNVLINKQWKQSSIILKAWFLKV